MLKVHSVETMAALDGPGIRVVYFLQGCPLRCLYCHNPDTWEANSGTEINCEEILHNVLRYKNYFSQNGGITFSGGEPLLQARDLIPCLRLLKANNIHTTIDTSGFFPGSSRTVDELLKYTDLVILDIKHENPLKYMKITGRSLEKHLEFKNILIKSKCKIWLKHVIVPNLTDDKPHILQLEKEVMTYPLDRVEKFELLPYHSLGKIKYEELHIDYRLKATEDMDIEKLKDLKKLIKLGCLV